MYVTPLCVHSKNILQFLPIDSPSQRCLRDIEKTQTIKNSKAGIFLELTKKNSEFVVKIETIFFYDEAC